MAGPLAMVDAAAGTAAAAVAAAVDTDRLWQRLEALAAFGATATGGVCRLALSKAEGAARRQIAHWARADGLEVFTDPVGNLFVELAGADPDAPPVMTGSHIDSQPTGGWFDGSFGVLAGLEVLAAVRRLGTVPPRRLIAVAWMNEEASRFAPGMMGSRGFCGDWPLADILEVRDADGVSVGEALARLRQGEPDIPERPLGFPLTAFIEAHIEQGPVLEARGLPIGIVTGIQGTRRYRVRVTGEAGHAGTVPPADRKDALFAAARIIAAIEAAAPPDLMVTVGMLRLTPGAPSVIPSEAFFSVDIRHVDDALLAEMDRRLRACIEARRGPCAAEVAQIACSPTVGFPAEIRARIAQAAQALGYGAQEMLSAAGHDARHLPAVCPAGMIFIPCRNGVSHSEEEWVEAAHVTAGARTLAHAVASLALAPPAAGA